MKIIVEVSGGVVTDLHRLGSDFSWAGEWYVLDYDDIEADAKVTWERMGPELRTFVRDQFPDEYAKWFQQFEGG
jgi:hypothetical protein